MFLKISLNINFKRFNFKRLCLFLRPSWISDLGQKQNFENGFHLKLPLTSFRDLNKVFFFIIHVYILWLHFHPTTPTSQKKKLMDSNFETKVALLPKNNVFLSGVENGLWLSQFDLSKSCKFCYYNSPTVGILCLQKL